jgi:hypothetical protein
MESSSAALGWALEKETPRPRDAVDVTFIGTAPASGVSSYIVKPVGFEAFLETVSKIGLYWVLTNRTPQ